MATPTVQFASYNPTGLDSSFKTQWTRELLGTFKVDYVCFQEHFKKNVGNFFSSYFPGFSSYIVPATRGQNQESGRPKGGLAQYILQIFRQQ